MNYIKTIFDLWQLKRNEKKTAWEISSLQTKKLKRLLHVANLTQEEIRGFDEKETARKKRLILTDMEAA